MSADQPQSTMTRPLEDEHRRAIDRLNEALWAMRTAREIYDERRAELASIARRYYAANPDLPVPVWLNRPWGRLVADQPNTTKCRALAQGTAGGHDPADCDWPHCGCDVPVTIVQEFMLPEGLRSPIRVRGVGRVADEPRALIVLFTDIPTNDELRRFHDYIRDLECARHG